MSAADAVGIAGLVLAILGIVISIYYGRKALYPIELELQWYAEWSALIPDDVETNSATLELRVDGQIVGNPYFARLSLKNCGKRAIESSMFDQGRPLQFTVADSASFHLLTSAAPAATTATGLRVGPEMLPSGETWRIALLSDGAPDVTLAEHHLSNVRVRNVAPSTGTLTSAATALYERISLAATSATAIGIIAAIVGVLSG